MVDLMLAGDSRKMKGEGVVRTVYDPCCGSGGMLMISKEHITLGWREGGEILRGSINADAEIHLFGQEVNPETWAVSKSDLFMKDPTGRDADNIAFGSTLSNDRHASMDFDYLIANPPYGKDWKRDEEAVSEEHERGQGGRFGPDLPRISDGQLLFLLHMLSHMKDPKEEGGSRVAIIMNGSPLFTGDSGSGESEIRRYVLENDFLEAIVALPEQLFYNTGIATYILNTTGDDAIKLDRGKSILKPKKTKEPGGPETEELEALSRIIAELNERFGLDLGPEHRLTIGRMMERLDDDAALAAASRANTRENVRLTFDQKVEDAIQEIVDTNFELYKRITDDQAFGEVVKSFLFDQYLRGHRSAEELMKQGESKTLEFKSSLRWNLRDDRKDDEVITHAVLKTIAAFLNTEGGDLLIGVADDRSVVGIEVDRFESDDKFMLHLAQCVRNGLGDRAGTCIDPRIQITGGKPICVVACQRSPEPVFLKWKKIVKRPEGDFYVRSGPGSVRLEPESAREYIRTRFSNDR
jgi:hypothetical protein